LLLLCLMVGLGAVVWLLQEPTAPPLAPTPAAPVPAPAADPAAGAALAATPAATVPEPATSASERLPAAAPSPTAAPAVIFGRCVDDNHAPLPAATVKLHVQQRGPGRKPAPVEQQTGADGRFEFAFEPRLGQSFTLYVTAEGRIGHHALWPAFQAGERFDCGSFVMRRGIVVRGRVEDTNHAPVADASVLVWHGGPDAPRGAGPGRKLFLWTRTGVDGTFATDGALPAGEFCVQVNDDQQQQPPTTGVLAIERPVEFVTIVVPAIEPSEWITGTVVDQRGSPLPRAWVDAGDGNTQALTRNDGSFRLHRSHRADPRQMVQLRVMHDDHEHQAVGPQVAWGSTRIELRVMDGNSLELSVRDQHGRPVEDFDLTLGDGKSKGTRRSVMSKQRAGPFPDGIVLLKGVTLGPTALLIEFGATAPHPPRLLAIDLAAQHTRLDVLAEPLTTRTLEVVDGNGEPVAGVPIQLCDPVDGEFLPSTAAVTGAQILRPRVKQALLLQTTTTDAFGRATLRGPGTRELGVRLPGPGHEPTQLANVSLSLPEPLRLEVKLGAHLTGKLGPLDAVEFLRGLAGDAAAQQRTPLRLLLQRPDHDPKAPPLPFVTLAADGSFDQRGLLPGTYSVMLQHERGYEALGEVTLVDGRTTRFDPELPVALMTPGTLAGRVLKNGQPAPGVQVGLLGTCAAVNGRTRNESAGARTDADGRFRVELRPGTYRATVQFLAPRAVRAALSMPETAVITSRTTTEQDFTVATGTLQVTLRSADGSPMPDVTIWDTLPDLRQAVMLPPSDANGTTTMELPPGPIGLRTLPAHLQSAEARTKVLMQGGWSAFDELWLPLGTANVAAGSTTTIELRLPADGSR
jgi:hypothetical protein